MRRLILSLLLLIGAPAAAEPFLVVSEPYAPFFGPDLPAKGWTWRVAEAALSHEGYAPELAFKPWTRALHESKTGQMHGLFGAFRTSEREADYLFSRPFATARLGFFRLRERTDLSFDGDLDAMRGLLIGVGEGYSYGETFDSFQGLRKDLSIDTLTAMRKLYFGRIDVVAGNDPVDLFNLRIMLSNDFPDAAERIVFMEPAFSKPRLHLAVSRRLDDARERIAAFNRGLAALAARGDYARILGAHSLTPGQGQALPVSALVGDG